MEFSMDACDVFLSDLINLTTQMRLLSTVHFRLGHFSSRKSHISRMTCTRARSEKPRTTRTLVWISTGRISLHEKGTHFRKTFHLQRVVPFAVWSWRVARTRDRNSNCKNLHIKIFQSRVHKFLFVSQTYRNCI